MIKLQAINCSILPKFLLLGDSITEQGYSSDMQGYVSLLSEHYVRRADMINRGVSGYNTRWYLSITLNTVLEEWKVMNPHIRLVTLFLGANDGVAETSQQHVPLNEYQKNMKIIIQKIQSTFPQAKILLITPPDVDEKQWIHSQIANGASPEEAEKNKRSTELITPYVQSVIEIGKTMNINVINLFEKTSSKISPNPNLRDGLHLSLKGNAILFHLLIEYIDKHFTELSKDSLQPQFVLCDSLKKDEVEIPNENNGSVCILS